MSAQSHILPDGRLHLQHGPIDLIVGADGPEGARELAFAAAQMRFQTVLTELVPELPLLRAQMTKNSPVPKGVIARRMDRAVRGFADQVFVTPMAAVAGAVADTVLQTMCQTVALTRAYVNNGGDIALHLASDAHFTLAMQDHSGRDLGRINLCPDQDVGGVATSGRHGRSLSLGIADSVTVLARTAAAADAAATLIANAVDLPGHAAIRRCAAVDIDPDSDLGTLPVVTGCGPLNGSETAAALEAGAVVAGKMMRGGQILAASLFLNGDVWCDGKGVVPSKPPNPLLRSLAHA
ncbi:hypothetical protein TG4357_02628 [Thalassovita gelatinovora]|uniref:Thiamine biosynthesis protein ApbE n=1 Tax=Thalassovita gelatinovora TaxID=53501 RepID=A0A0P1FF86_THAGE|nr:UPF0280 family protein [Thalassovita gelatinovora]QIZ79757.1 UPF0280 family protein [Thalassovita gelatinovora]CUH66771.1 hypothetical protein TG4357_02628 [Thalassovita gelatinovora]SEQ42490.1 hypothetical protein SAMN04488043_105165 [Thalassovita gelatinovora]